MACRGVLFAIDQTTVDKLRAAKSEDDAREVVEDLEEAWNEAFLQETDKAWDAMHRALSDGTLDLTAGTPPLSLAIFGGEQLCESGEYYISFVSQEQVTAVAAALAEIDDDAMRRRYRDIVPKDYDDTYGKDDCEYTVTYFREVAEFYARAAAAGRAVIFTVDQ